MSPKEVGRVTTGGGRKNANAEISKAIVRYCLGHNISDIATFMTRITDFLDEATCYQKRNDREERLKSFVGRNYDTLSERIFKKQIVVKDKTYLAKEYFKARHEKLTKEKVYKFKKYLADYENLDLEYNENSTEQHGEIEFDRCDHAKSNTTCSADYASVDGMPGYVYKNKSSADRLRGGKENRDIVIDVPKLSDNNSRATAISAPILKLEHNDDGEGETPSQELLESHRDDSVNESVYNPDRVFCICQKPYDGSLMIRCQTYEKWYHPACVLQPNSLEMTFGEKQWALCNLMCRNGDRNDPRLNRRWHNFPHVTDEGISDQVVTNVMRQTDDRSCGVCSCLTARVMCTQGQITYPMQQDDFRNCILHELEMRSEKTHNDVSTSRKKCKNNHPPLGLQNLRQTCWFNSVIQAVLACLSHDEMPVLVGAVTGSTENIVANLLNNKQCSSSEITEAVAESCKACRFEESKQQCAVEFFESQVVTRIMNKMKLDSLIEISYDAICQTCNVRQNKIDKMRMVRLDSDCTEFTSLAQKLDDFFSPRKCYQPCSHLGTTRTEILSKPNPLVIHVNRTDGKQLNRSQIDTNDELRLDNVRYKLCAVVVRTGGCVDAGHFISYIAKKNGSTFVVDDSNVHKEGTMVSSDIMNQNGVLYFYIPTCPVKKNYSRIFEDDNDELMEK